VEFQHNEAEALDKQPTGREPIEITVIAPCFNETENVALLVKKLENALVGIEWEIVFVDDDSPDRTAATVRALAQQSHRVRCLQRIGRRGLSSAVIEGMLSSSAPFLAVIDADLQHDETLLPQMLVALKGQPVDIVVGSRYVDGGGIGIGGLSASRASISRLGTRLAKLVFKADLRDPMSGYFMITRVAFEQCVRRLSGMGYKILLDIFASSPEPLRFKEMAYTFRERQHGQSKVDSKVLLEYIELLIDKRIGWLVPVRFIMFAAVGATGVLVHFAVLSAALMSLRFTIAQLLATVAAMTSNYFINNLLIYRDMRRRGKRLLTGLLSFYAVCGIGAIANIGVAAAVFEHQYAWWAAALAGISVGVVWNYAMSATFTWKQR
jgi:dolichol-phosphate mannosyltransferase